MGKVKVELVEARNLVAKDLKLIGTSTSDPYVKLTVGSVMHKSSVVKKNISPQWRQTFEFQVNNPDQDQLLLEVFDHDLLSKDDKIGRTTVGFATLYRGTPADMWLKLNDVARGEVHVIITALDFGREVQQNPVHHAPPHQQPQYPPHQQPQYPPQQPQYPPHQQPQYPPQQPQYPPQQPQYPPHQQPQYPPQQPQYPPQQQPQYPPHQPQYPPQQGSQYPPQQGSPFGVVLQTPIHDKHSYKRAVDELERIFDMEKAKLKSSMSKEMRKPQKKNLKRDFEHAKDLLKQGFKHK